MVYLGEGNEQWRELLPAPAWSLTHLRARPAPRRLGESWFPPIKKGSGSEWSLGTRCRTGF